MVVPGYVKPMNQKKKRSIISTQHASGNAPDQTNNNSNIQRKPAQDEQKKLIHFIQILMICRVELPT